MTATLTRKPAKKLKPLRTAVAKPKVTVRPRASAPADEDAVESVDGDDEQEVPVKRTKAEKAKAPAAVAKKNKAAAKAKSSAKQDDPASTAKDDLQRRRRVASSVLLSILDEERKASGDFNVATLEEAIRMCVGIRVPFVFEYLIGASFFPLGRVIQIVGKTGSNKSALAFEIGKWFKAAVGSGILYDVEDKYNAALAQSVIGRAPSMLDTVMGIVRCDSCTDWQRKLQRNVRRLEYQMYGWSAKDEKVPKDLKALGKKFKPAGDHAPFFAIVDSVVAKLTEKAQEGVEERGYGDKKFADEALSITYFLKTFTKRVARLPMSLILINHLKLQKLEGSYIMERKKGGGTLIDFQETLELEMSKTAGKEYNSADRSAAMIRSVNTLKLKCTKNSYGATGRDVEVNMTWYNKPGEDGKSQQFTQWDWAGAAIDLLLSYKDKSLQKRVAEIVDIIVVREGKLYASKKLKVPRDKPVSKRELGKILCANMSVIRQLRQLFGIAEYEFFDHELGYRKQISSLRKRAFDVAKQEAEED